MKISPIVAVIYLLMEQGAIWSRDRDIDKETSCKATSLLGNSLSLTACKRSQVLSDMETVFSCRSVIIKICSPLPCCMFLMHTFWSCYFSSIIPEKVLKVVHGVGGWGKSIEATISEPMVQVCNISLLSGHTNVATCSSCYRLHKLDFLRRAGAALLPRQPFWLCYMI